MVSILFLVFSYPISFFAQDLNNELKVTDTVIPNLEKMPVNKVEKLNKSNQSKKTSKKT